jgi:hypothetical protein
MTLSETFPGGSGQETDAGRLCKGGENVTGNQSLLLLGVAFRPAGNDRRAGLVAVAHKHLFAVPDELNMGAELRFQIADIDGSHVSIIADVTMLVICHFSVWTARTEEQPFG